MPGNTEKQLVRLPVVREWDYLNPSHPVGTRVVYHGVAHSVIDAGPEQGLRLAAEKPNMKGQP